VLADGPCQRTGQAEVDLSDGGRREWSAHVRAAPVGALVRPVLGTGFVLDVWVPDSRGTSCVCVPGTLHRSCDLLILVEQPTEPVAPLDGVRLGRRRLEEWP
jgi:hypothetical protein